MPRIDFSDKSKAKIRELYWVHGIRPKEIAIRFQCGIQIVRRIINSQRSKA